MEKIDIGIQADLPKKTIKILAIDGGGIRGIIPIKILQTLEKRLGTNKPIAEYFDVMGGTSAGGIITCLLNVPNEHRKPKYTAHHAYDMFKRFGKSVFERSWWHRVKSLDGWVGDKYSDKVLMSILEEYLQNLTLQDAVKDIIIPAYEIFEETNYLFRKRKALCCNGGNFFLKDIAKATSAAPTYFNPAVIQDIETNQTHTFIDGGVSVNNPALSALVYAFHQYGMNANYFVVSIGTGTTAGASFSRVEYSKMNTVNVGKLGWAKNIISVLMDSVNDVTDHEMKEILPETHYYRLQVKIDPSHGGLDNATDENIAALEKYAEKLVLDNEHAINNIVKVLLREDEYV